MDDAPMAIGSEEKKRTAQLANNAKWLAAAQVFKVVLQLTSITVLAKLLEPKYYGVMAISNAVTTFAGLFRDLGTTAALIQAKDATEEVKSTSFWITSAMGAFLAIVLACIAAPIAGYYKEPELFWVMLIIAASFPVSAMAAVHATMMERAGRFRELTYLEVSVQAISLMCAIGLALLGFGVYSLAAPSLLVGVISTTYLLRAYKWWPTTRPTRESLGRVASFSANLTGFNLINYFARNADTMIIGRVLGAAPLGIYTAGMKLMLFPLQSITWVSNRALFPVLSQAQHNPKHFKELYLNTVAFVALLTFPLMTGLWITREEFVLVVYGDKWHGLETIIAWLAPVGLLQSVNSTTGTVYMAKGVTHLLLRVGTASAIVQVAAFVVGAQYGIAEVAAAYLVANLFTIVPNLLIVLKLLKASVVEGLRAVLAPATCTALMALACVLLRWQLNHRVSPAALLLAEIIAGALVYALGLRIAFPKAWSHLLSAVKSK